MSRAARSSPRASASARCPADRPLSFTFANARGVAVGFACNSPERIRCLRASAPCTLPACCNARPGAVPVDASAIRSPADRPAAVAPRAVRDRISRLRAASSRPAARVARARSAGDACAHNLRARADSAADSRGGPATGASRALTPGNFASSRPCRFSAPRRRPAPGVSSRGTAGENTRFDGFGDVARPLLYPAPGANTPTGRDCRGFGFGLLRVPAPGPLFEPSPGRRAISAYPNAFFGMFALPV